MNAGSAPERPLLVVQGAQLDDGDALADELARLAGGRPKVHVAPYTADPNQLAYEMGRASLAIMPSRQEGFGLVGLDAIAAGVPVLVSAASGLGEVLSSLGGAAARCVVEVEDVEDRDAQRWATAIRTILDDRSAAFVAAGEVRYQVAQQCRWPACAQVLLAELGLVADATAPATPPSPVFSLPQRDRAFFGRAAVLEQVDEALGDPACPAAVALVGAPGSGRGAVALQAAWRRHQLYDTVWSVVGSPEALDDALAKLADALGLDERLSVEQAAEVALGWFTGHGRWLLLLEGTGVAERLAQRAPERLGGHLLMVGEAPQAWATDATVVEVGPFVAEESVELLLGRGGDPDAGAARELAEALGGRPLAVTTAAAYLNEGAYTVQQLLERLRDSAPSLFDEDAGSATAVVEMLRLAHEELSRRPLAVEALNLAAFMGEGPIPVELIGGEGFVPLSDEAQVEGDLAVGEMALGTAERFSQLVRSERTVRLDPEVARRTRQDLGDEAGAWAAQAVRTVLRAVQGEDGHAERALVGHALAATAYAMQHVQSVDVMGLHAQITALRLRAAGLLTDEGEPAAAETALASVSDFLASRSAEEHLDPELIIAVGRARGRLARLESDEERAQGFEDDARTVAHTASMRPPVLPGLSCEMLLAVLEEPPSGPDDPWYCALAFRALQASGSVLAESQRNEPAEVWAAAELGRKVAAHLAERGQHEDVVAVAEAALAVTPAEPLRTAVAGLGEMAAVALDTLGDTESAQQYRSRVVAWISAGARP